MDDLHNYPRRVNGYLKRIRESELSDSNKRLLEKFADDCLSERLTYGRVYKHLYHLLKIARLLQKDFAEADIDDIRRIVRSIETGPENYAESTKKDFRISIKKFWKWINGGTCPDSVKWIKTEIKRCEKRMPEEFLTQEEVRTLVKASDNPRDKAFVFVLYESGCRIGEMMGMRLKHVQFDKYGAQILVHGKTGARRVRIIMACDYLRYWIENHPRRSDPEAFAWVNLSNSHRGERLNYPVIHKRLHEIARRAGVTKRVNFHAFRHARATHLANKLTEVQLCEIFGWTLSSRMPATYVHLSGRNVDDALLKMYGLKEKAEDESITCPRCKSINDTVSRYCNKCGLPFGLDVALEAEQERGKYDDLMSKLMENEDVRMAIIRALGSVRREGP